MAAVLCADCLRTYTPYKYSETLQRALVSGVEEWQGVDNEESITSRYNDVLYIRHGITGTIRNLFPSSQHFRDCHRQFNRERRKKISARFLCFDCEKYLCAKCITQHSEHFILSEDDKDNVDNWDKIETKIMHGFNKEGDTKEEYIKQEKAVLCDVVDMKDSLIVTEWENFMSLEREDVFMLGKVLDIFYLIWDICILNDNQTLLVINDRNARLKVYNSNSYKLIGTIELPYRPVGITEISSTDPSQSLIAVSFLNERHIDIMNIRCRPVQVISSINVHGTCYDLAFCNNKLITSCGDHLDGECPDSIHVMDMSGEIINTIDLDSLPSIKPGWLYKCRVSVHSESETVYVCLRYYGVICLSLSGQVLHSTKLTDMILCNICVDRDQNVYVMGHSLPLYKLSSDLSERVKILDEDEVNVGWVTCSSIVHHKNKIYMLSVKGFVYILSVD